MRPPTGDSRRTSSPADPRRSRWGRPRGDLPRPRRRCRRRLPRSWLRPAALRQSLGLLEEVAPLAGGLQRARVVARSRWKVALATVAGKLPGPDGEGPELDAARSAISAVLLDVLAAPVTAGEADGPLSVLERLGAAPLGPAWTEVPEQAVWARQVGSRLEIAVEEAVFLEGDRGRLLARLGPGRRGRSGWDSCWPTFGMS